jgi:hypothetical protein
MCFKNLILILIILILVNGCAQRFKGFAEPESEKSMLVVGRLIVEDNGYTERPNVYKDGLQIAIYGECNDGSEIGEWVRTDENGYYVLANVPMGEYVIKAVRLTVGNGQLTTIENRLSFSDEPYLITNREFFIFDGDYFPFEPVGRVQSLKHHVFMLDVVNRNILMVRNAAMHKLKDVQLHNGEVLNAPPVENYFIEKHPNSKWNTLLSESAEVDRYPR